MNDAEKPERARNWFLRHPVVVAALLFLLTAAFICFALSYRAGRIVDRLEAQIRAKGEPLTFAEVLARRPRVGDEENMAPGVLAAVVDIDAEFNTPDFREHVSPLLHSFGMAKPTPLGQRWPEDEIVVARAFVARHENSYKALLKAAHAPKGRYAVASRNPPISNVYPYYAGHRTACRALCLASAVAALDGDMGQASSLLESAAALDRCLDAEPTLIGFFVQIACRDLTLGGLGAALGSGELSDNQLREWQRRLAAWDATTSLQCALWGERASVNESIDWVYQTGGGPGSLPPIRAIRLVPTLASTDRAAALRLMTKCCDATKLPPIEAIRAANAIDAETTALPEYCLVSKKMVASTGRVFVMNVRFTATVRAARAAIAVERFRMANGKWPSMLTDTVPNYLDAVPEDPFDGKPLRYRSDANDARVWSIGEDGRDDGGDIAGLGPWKYRKATDVGVAMLSVARRNRVAATQPAAGQ